jgi:hypothetical protein
MHGTCLHSLTKCHDSGTTFITKALIITVTIAKIITIILETETMNRILFFGSRTFETKIENPSEDLRKIQ